MLYVYLRFIVRVCVRSHAGKRTVDKRVRVANSRIRWICSYIMRFIQYRGPHNDVSRVNDRRFERRYGMILYSLPLGLHGFCFTRCDDEALWKSLGRLFRRGVYLRRRRKMRCKTAISRNLYVSRLN